MGCHVVLVEEKAGPSCVEQAARAAGWRTTRLDEGALAHAWVRNSPPDLLIVGERLADLSAGQLVRTIKLDHACNHLPLIQLGSGPSGGEVEVEPDAWLGPDDGVLLPVAAAQARSVCAGVLREGDRAEVRFRLPSDNAHLEELVRLLGPWFAACGFGSHHVQQLILSLRELGANAIEWGHGNDRSRPVSITCRLDHEKVSVTVRDTGCGFDPADLPHAAHPGDPLSHMTVRAARQLREGGFGILMTRGLVDQLCYNEAGNEAQMLKYLPVRVQQHQRETPGQPVAAGR
jgi:anti-sigma regulatory factor (Ser/Thr protein kinase)